MSGFAEEDRPDTEQINNCIRCGMCLPTCPTYQLTGRERSSPRGRIALIRAVDEGRMELESPLLAEEMSDCLGCLACVTACPAGVEYGPMLEATRDQLRRHHSPKWPWWKKLAARLALGSFERPWILNLLGKGMWLYQKSGLATLLERLLPGRLRAYHRLMPSVTFRSGRSQLPALLPGSRGRVGVLLGCVMDVMFAEENMATVRVLQRQGFAVVNPPQQSCCGALHAHAGQLDWARQLARKLMVAFEGVDYIVVNSAGCSAAMKHYEELFAGDSEWHERAHQFSSRVRDVQEFLASIELRPALPVGQQALTYHDACHLAHGQGVRQAPRQLLRQIAGSGYRELSEADMCCGSAGTYNLTHPETAQKLLDRKVEAILASGAQVVGVANPGCLLQIRAGLKQRGSSVRAVHPVVLLDEAWQKAETQIEQG